MKYRRTCRVVAQLEILQQHPRSLLRDRLVFLAAERGGAGPLRSPHICLHNTLRSLSCRYQPRIAPHSITPNPNICPQTRKIILQRRHLRWNCLTRQADEGLLFVYIVSNCCFVRRRPASQLASDQSQIY